MAKSRVPNSLKSGIAAVLLVAGLGTGVVVSDSNQTAVLMQNQYIQAAGKDVDVSPAVKIAMAMGSFYESSYKHIGKPYVDRLGKGQPLTVCNGITGKGVFPNKIYSPRDCYLLEKPRYLSYEVTLKRDLQGVWGKMNDYQRAAAIDFLHNKGEGAFRSSTMRRKLLAGDIIGACRENEKWNRGTINGVSTVLPGLKARGDGNTDLCIRGLE